ncbi:hypothetical protein HOLleu_16561 [Holothuria leucospilota]|uniref:Uncharacterized protein n=1 Tax=Holothuria leucospilota TaxID=206669 RepID=A0A9Q1HAI0_HOLLE|nr:hypothetical protein HOLleu_16561 [Holothuria leucospilota]
MKIIYGPSKRGTIQILDKDGTSILTDKQEQINRWHDHFCELLNRQGTITEEALGRVKSRPILHELDAPPTLEEVMRASKQLKPNKALRPDGIAAEIFQHGGDQLTSCMHRLFTKIWEDVDLPQDFRDDLIVTIYKNKGYKETATTNEASLSSRLQ